MYPLFVCGTYMGDLLIVIYSDDGKQTTVVRLSGSTEKQITKFNDKGQPLYSSNS